MKRMNTILATLAILQLACASASAQQREQRKPPREVPFTMISARVERMPRPMQMRGREYREALVVRISVDRERFDSLPPSVEAFLYLGPHELRPIDVVRDDQRKDLVLTFHDPDWTEIREPVPMVLTTLHGDPQVNPEKYANRPRFDPKTIGRDDKP